MSTSATDRLFTEVDRQLGDVKSSAEGLATRAGLLISATALAAGLLSSRLQQAKSGLLIAALVVLGIAIIVGSAVLTPGLTPGPATSSLSGWAATAGTGPISLLFNAKLLTLDSNRQRLTIMKIIFYAQCLIVTGGIILAVCSAAGL